MGERHDKQKIDDRHNKLAIGNSIGLGILGLSALMVGIFQENFDLWLRIVLVILGALPCGFAPIIYKRMTSTKPPKGMLKLIIFIETAIERNIITKLSTVYNFVFGGIKLIIGLFTGSYFFAVSAVYSFCNGLARQVYLNGVKESNGDISQDYKYYSKIAWLIILGSLVYGIYMARLFFVSDAFNYGMITGIAIATLSFAEVFFSVKGLLQKNDILSSAIKCVSAAGSFLALAFTQVAVTSFSSTTDMTFSNALGGVILSCLAAGVGVYMLTRVAIFKKKQNNN